METIYQSPQYDAQLIVDSMHDKMDLIQKCVNHSEPLLYIRPPIILYGKEMGQPRDVAFFSDEVSGYNYSRKMMPSLPLCDEMKEIIEIVNKTFNAEYNAILINRYNDGNDYISAHSDNQTNLLSDSGAGVVSLSYGSTRKFRIRKKSNKKIVAEYDVKSGDILQMRGRDFQRTYTHEIPVQKRIKSARYSFTFREHKA